MLINFDRVPERKSNHANPVTIVHNRQNTVRKHWVVEGMHPSRCLFQKVGLYNIHI